MGEVVKRTQMRPVSRKRAGQLRAYSKLRAVFLAEHPRCGFPLGCGLPSTEVQHMRGRRGERLNDTAWWAASCHDHNQWAETNTGEALAIGWLVPIEQAS